MKRGDRTYTEPRDDLSSEGSRVYFLKCGDFIKVGRSKVIDQRIIALKTGNPHAITLLGSVPGGSLEERAAHEALASYRVEGEWFTDCAPVRAHMRMLFASVMDRSNGDQLRKLKTSIPLIGEVKSCLQTIVDLHPIVTDGPMPVYARMIRVDLRLIREFKYPQGSGNMKMDDIDMVIRGSRKAIELAQSRLNDLADLVTSAESTINEVMNKADRTFDALEQIMKARDLLKEGAK